MHAQFRAWAILAMSPLEVAFWHIAQAFSRLKRSFSDTCTRTPVDRHTHHHTPCYTNHALHHACTCSTVWAYVNVSFMQVRQEGAQQFTQRLDIAQHSMADKLFVWHAVLCEAETETLHPVVVVVCTGMQWRKDQLSKTVPSQALTFNSIALANLLSSGMRNVNKSLVLGDTRILMEEMSATELKRTQELIGKKLLVTSATFTGT